MINSVKKTNINYFLSFRSKFTDEDMKKMANDFLRGDFTGKERLVKIEYVRPFGPDFNPDNITRFVDEVKANAQRSNMPETELSKKLAEYGNALRAVANQGGYFKDSAISSLHNSANDVLNQGQKSSNKIK